MLTKKHLLTSSKKFLLRTHAPVTLALEKAGVRTASDLVSLKLDPDVPLKYDRAVEGGNKVEKNEKNIPLLQAEMRPIIGIQEYIQYYSKNVSHKFFESLDDWEELTAKNFISFRINIAPFLPPDVTPPAVVAQSDLAINDGEDDALQFSIANEADFNIDSDPMTPMANAHRSRELSANRVLMHSEQWKGMSPKGQEIWDQHSDEDKTVVLSKPATVMMRPNQPSNERELSKPATVVTRRDQPSNEREPSSHMVNVHDTTVYDSIVANAHLLDYGEATDDAEDDAVRTEVDKSNDEEAQTLHGFLASHGNNSSPADVRNVLSTSLKRVPSKLPKDHQANAHITYAMDKCHMDKPGSLIDRGANGGMAGADEWEMLPHVHWTRDSDWDPAIFNHEFGDNDDEWDDPVMDHRDLFDKVGNYCNHQGVDAGEVHSSRQIEVTISRLHFQACQVRPGEQDWETLCRLFGWAKHYKDAYGVS